MARLEPALAAAQAEAARLQGETSAYYTQLEADYKALLPVQGQLEVSGHREVWTLPLIIGHCRLRRRHGRRRRRREGQWKRRGIE